MFDFNTQLRTLREKVADETDRCQKLVAKADGENRSLNDGEREAFAASETTLTELRARIDDLERAAKLGPHSQRVNDTTLTAKEEKRYSLTRLILAAASPENRRAQEGAMFEREVSEEIAHRIGRPSRGVYVPRGVFNRNQRSADQRALVTTVGSAGGYLVAEELHSENFIGMLRASIIASAGATRMPGLVGDVLIPRQTGAGSHYWLATEEADATESAQTFGQVRLSPKHGAAHTRYSRQTLVQASPAVEGIVVNDLNRIVGLAIDTACLTGTGVGGQPLGLKLTTGVNDPTNFAAAIPTWAELMTMVGTTALDNSIGIGGSEDNRAPGNIAWIMEGQMYSDLMAKSKDAGSGFMVIDGQGRIGPYTVGVSNNVTTGDIWFGAWENLLIGSWGDPDLIVNPYTSDTSGTIRLTLHHMTDVAVRYAEAFCFNNDG